MATRRMSLHHRLPSSASSHEAARRLPTGFCPLAPGWYCHAALLSLLLTSRPENLQSLEAPLLEVLNGILSGLGQPPLALCDAVLSALVSPAAAAVEGKGLAVGPAAQYTAGAQR